MRSLLSLIVLVALALPAAAQDMVGISWTGSVYSVNSTTGAGAFLGASGFSSVNSMAKHPNGTLYSLAGYGVPETLFTINTTTGAGTAVATTTLTSARGMAFDGAGTLYVINDSSGTGIGEDYLYTVDIATGAATLIGSTTYFGVQGLTYANGQLYGWELGTGSGVGAGLITINAATGLGTDVNPSIGNNGSIQTLCTSPTGALYGLQNSVYQVDAVTGSATLVGGSGFSDLRGAEFTGATGGFTLARTGSCPGPNTLTTAGGTPGGPQAYLYGAAGSFTQTGSPCTGLTLPISAPTLAGILAGNGAGSSTVTFNAPMGLCGLRVVVVDVAACVASNSITL